jgi:hypothetical protein
MGLLVISAQTRNIGLKLALQTVRKTSSFVTLVSFLVYLYVFEFESSRRFQFSFTDLSLAYRSAFAQIFPRPQPMK